ncbi:phage tail assembly chaperone GT [Bacillaceae bacterium W0354]
MMNHGKDVNEILNMPFNFVLDILADKNKPKETKSLIAAFGG